MHDLDEDYKDNWFLEILEDGSIFVNMKGRFTEHMLLDIVEEIRKNR